MLRLTTLCSTNITAVWIKARLTLKNPTPKKTPKKTKYIEWKVHINSDENYFVHLIFLVVIILQSQKKDFYLWSNTLGVL